MNKFDLVVIGSGPGGYRAAVLATLRGLKVAIVEKSEWGGCCLNRGCVPKKDWYHSARLIAASREFSARGIHGALHGELKAAWSHQRNVVATVRDSYADYLKRLGVAAFRGVARFIDSHTIAVGDTAQLCAAQSIIATGSSPFVPSALPLCRSRILTTDDLFERELPAGRRVALIGSGVVGAEFAFILSAFGLDIIWLMQQAPLTRSAFSLPARNALYAAWSALGIRPRTGSRVAAAEVSADAVRLTLPDGSQETVDWVLLGAGRVPHTAGLGLAAAGVDVDAGGYIKVDPYQQTTAPSIYAIGDVANRAMTSNHALAEAAVAVGNIIAAQSCRRNAAAVPEVIYSALELARIGMNEDFAEDAGLEPAVGFTAFGVNPAALGQGDTRGFVRLIADTESGRLLGAEVVGKDAAELIHIPGVEFGAETALKKLAGAAYNHPTRAEEILNAAETLASRWRLGQFVFGPAAGTAD